jgi:branched-chain amino acid transport system ATP-binding protein
MGFVMNICERVCAINFGKFLAIDKPKNIQQNPDVQEAYLGKDEG